MLTQPQQRFALEQFLIWYARHFPYSKGKLRVVNTLAPHLIKKYGPYRTAVLSHADFRAPCDLREMLQRQMFFFGTYFLERNNLRCWSHLARTASTVLDVGANAGIYSLAALASNANATVHAFEPTPEIAARLQKTASMNGLHQLFVHQLGLAETSGNAVLIRCRGGSDNEGMNFIRSQRSDVDGEEIATISLDHFAQAAKLGRIDLIKMDVQGFEAAVLRGGKRLLENRQLGHLFMELNWAANEDNCPAREFLQLLKGLGYRFAIPSIPLIFRSHGEWLEGLSDIVARSEADR